MNTGGVYIIEDVGLEDEDAMHKGPFVLSSKSGKVEQKLVPMLQKEIPDIRFYVTGGKNFKNQPIGIITF